MWKLTIAQKRKSEYSDYVSNYQVQLFSESLHELVDLVDKMTNLVDEAIETTYKIESAKEGEE